MSLPELEPKAPDRLFDQEMVRNTLEAVVKGLAEGVVLTDSAGRPQLVNPAARTLLALPPEGSHGPVLEATEEGRTLLSHLRSVLERREPPGPRELTVEGSHPRRVAVKTALVTTPQGEVRGTVAVLEDVTVRCETTLLQSEFVAAVSHELRTPLSCAKNYVDMVLDSRAGELNDTQSRFLGTARRNIDRLTHLIDNLLELARSEEEEIEPCFGSVDLTALTRASLEAVRSEAGEKGLKLVSELPEKEMEIQGDVERLGQAVDLLIRQAVKLGRRGSRVVVRQKFEARDRLRLPRDEKEVLAAHGRWAWMSIRLDDSVVQPAEASDLFRRFRGADKGDGQPVVVAGLALAIVRNLIEAHEGMVWAEAQTGGRLCFNVVLPPEGRSTRQDELLQKIRALLTKSRRDGRNLSLMCVRLGGREVAAKEGAVCNQEKQSAVHEALRSIAGLARRSLRSKDLIFIDREDGELVLILEGTDGRGAKVVTARLGDNLRSLDRGSPGVLDDFVLEMGCSTFPEEGVTAQEIMALARRRCVPLSMPSVSPTRGG